MIALARTIVVCLLLALRASAALPVTPAQLGSVRAAAIDSSGLVWLGGPSGLFRWDGAHLLQQDGWEGWDGGGVGALGVDARSRLWVLADSGLYSSDEQFQRLDLRSAVIQGRGRRLAFDGDAVWAATDRGLLRVDERGAERELLTGIAVTSLARLSGGDFVAGTAGRGLVAFDPVGNPRLAGESALAVVADLLPDDDGALWTVARGPDGRWSLGLGPPGAAPLRRIELETAPDFEAPRLLQRVAGQLLLRGTRGWLGLDGERLRPLTLPVPAIGAPDLGRWLPLTALDPPGRFHRETPAGGVLVRRGAEVALAWQGGAGSSLRPVQVAAGPDGVVWTLLEDERGNRRLLEQDAGGTRERLPDPALAGHGGLRTICPDPAGRGLLAGWPDRLLLLSSGGDRLLSSNFGAHWLEPFADKLVLLGGESGLALLEGDSLRELRVREPVRRVVPDGFSGMLAACEDYLLRLDALNQIDTIAYPETLAGAGRPAGERVRQLLTGEAGRFWLLADDGVHYRSGEQAGWTRPLEGRLPAGAEGPGGTLSIALDGRGRIWISTVAGSGWLDADRLPPVVVLLQDPRRLDLASSDFRLLLDTADPFGAGRAPRLRWRIGDSPWSAWRPPGTIDPDELRSGGDEAASVRLQLQALDSWGNVSRRPLTLTLTRSPVSGRLPFHLRLALLLSLMGVSVLITLRWPGLGGRIASVGLGAGAGLWLKLATPELLMPWALPVFLYLVSLQVGQAVLKRRNGDDGIESGAGLLDLVDRFREFGHSGSATRNVDRLLRTSRNLYLDGRVDPEVLERFHAAQGVFLELTRPSLEELLKAFRRLEPGEIPLAPSELELASDLVRDISKLLEEPGDPPAARLEELAFHLDRLEKTLGELEHRVDLQISSAPLKVLDRVLDSRSSELAGVELALSCDRELRQVLARLPVDKLLFILDNLVDNALYWMREKPRRRLEIEVSERPSALQIRVRDTGPGVPAAEREAIFEAGRSGRPTGGGGGGYGLHRSRELLARFGGRLTVEDSAPGEGACFLLEIKKVEPERR